MPTLQTEEMRLLDLQEKDYLQDLLSTQKKVTSDYNHFANETSHRNLKADLLNILREEQEAESSLFDKIVEKGWYEVKAASTQDIKKARDIFNELDKKHGL